jgi:hypothetical protein
VETLTAMWEQIEKVVPRHELAAAIASLFELTPPLDSDADESWRAMLVSRFGTVRPFLKLLLKVVDFGATPEGHPVLAALKSLQELTGRKKVGPKEIDTDLLVGSWRRLVLSAPHLEPGTVDWKAYTCCILEQFHRMLRRREVFAKNSSKWGDSRAKLLAGWRCSPGPAPTKRSPRSVTGGEARLKDLPVTIAALLVAHGCNVGYTPVIGGIDALKYGRLSHVDQTYLRLATYRAANATLIEHQAAIGLAPTWGGGLVASVDGCGS